MASPLFEIKYEKIPEFFINIYNNLTPETKAYFILALGLIAICFVLYLGYVFIDTIFDKRKKIYKLELIFPKADQTNEANYIRSMQSFFSSVHSVCERERLSFEIHKVNENISIILTTTKLEILETLKKYLTSIQGISMQVTTEEPLKNYEKSYAKRLYLDYSFFTINLEEKSLFTRVVDYLASLDNESRGSILFFIRPIRDKDRQIHQLINKNDQSQKSSSIRSTKQTLDSENLIQKTKNHMFLVQVYVLGNKKQIPRELASIFKIMNAKARFVSKSLLGRKNASKLSNRHLQKENLFTRYLRGWFGSYLNSNELSLMIHPTDVERGIFKPTKSVIIESSPEFFEAEANKLLIGSSHNKLGEKKSIYLPVENLRRHLYILGSTGSGKSTVLIRTALSACKDKTKSLIFFDPHEVDLEMIARRLPDLSDVVYFKLGAENSDRTISFNPLFSFRTTDVQKDTLTEDILNILEQEAKDNDLGTSIKKLLKFLISTGVHFADAYYKYLVEVKALSPEQAEKLVYERQITLPDLSNVLKKNSSFKDTLLTIFSNYGNKNIALRWQQELDDYLVNKAILDGIDNRLSNIVTDTTQPLLEGNSFDIRELIKNNKKILIPISESVFGNVSKKMITKLLLAQIWSYAQFIYDPDNEAERVQIIIDEMQEAESPLIPRMLSEARKYGVSLVLAHQYLNQVSQKFLNSVLGNVGSTLIFNMGNQKEIKEIVGLYGGDIEEKDISNLPPFSGFLRTLKNNNQGRALMSFETMDYRTEFEEINSREVIKKLITDNLEEYGEDKNVLFEKRRAKVSDAEKYFFYNLK